MNYEQKYKEALNRAQKELRACGSTNSNAYRQIVRLFPELKESEDERIRKALINGFKEYDYPDNEWALGITPKEAISWLEKQKPTEDYNPYKATVESISAMFQKGITDIQDFVANVKVKIQDAIEYDTGERTHTNKQNPVEWSEEDENSFIDTLQCLQLYDAQGAHKINVIGCINWLKSLKQRITKQ